MNAGHNFIAAATQGAGIDFPVHLYMLRHATGFYLANAAQDTRAIQLYLGLKNIRHAVRYTAGGRAVQRLLEGLTIDD